MIQFHFEVAESVTFKMSFLLNHPCVMFLCLITKRVKRFIFIQQNNDRSLLTTTVVGGGVVVVVVVVVDVVVAESSMKEYYVYSD